MRAHDFITEKAVVPGDTKEINLYLDDYKKKLAKLKNDRKSGLLNPKQMAAYPKLVKQYELAIAKLKKSKEPAEQGLRRLKNILHGIAKNCSDIIEVYKQTQVFLYRGASQSSEAIFGKPHDNRKPMDSKKDATLYFDQALAAAGIEARRTNSIFTGTQDTAEMYGNPYIIFPVNGFKFTWSETEEDLILDGYQIPKMINKDKVVQLYNELTRDQAAFTRFKESNYPFKEATSLIMTNYGFFGDAYFDKHFNEARKLASLGVLKGEVSAELAIKGLGALVDSESIPSRFAIKTDNLSGAIFSTNEVMIRGAYYGVSAKYESTIREVLGIGGYAIPSEDDN